MCYNWKFPPLPNESSIDELKDFVTNCASFIEAPFEMNIAGGEPFLKPGILDLIRHIVSYGYSLSVTTNAYLFSNKKLLNDVLSSGLDNLPISLDSLDENIHDKLRGRQGSFRAVMDTFNILLKNRGCLRSLTVQTIIMKPNLDGIIDLVKWTSERGIAIYFMAIMRPVGIDIDTFWFKKNEYKFLWPDDINKVEKVIDQLIALKDKGYQIENKRAQLFAFKEYFRNPTIFIKNGPCSLGYGIINVGPDGNIYLCWEKGPIGNIKQDNIKTLWLSSKAKEMRSDILTCRRNCAEMVNCFFENE